jgi:uncharacterized radical SAM superfamily protein
MQNLITSANIAKPDDMYEKLISAHEGLTKEQSDALNARLILILLNHIGDETVIHQALDLAVSTHSHSIINCSVYTLK